MLYLGVVQTVSYNDSSATAMINIAVIVSRVLIVSWFKKVYSRFKEDEMKTAYIY